MRSMVEIFAIKTCFYKDWAEDRAMEMWEYRGKDKRRTTAWKIEKFIKINKKIFWYPRE